MRQLLYYSKDALVVMYVHANIPSVNKSKTPNCLQEKRSRPFPKTELKYTSITKNVMISLKQLGGRGK